MSYPPSSQDVLRHLVSQVFDKPLLTNVHRSLVVEAIVALALGEEWNWLGGYSTVDFQHRKGSRLELKQSAAKQSWHKGSGRPSKAVFDIAIRRRVWDNAKESYVENLVRHADVYVFAHNPEVGDGADHRDPMQWEFYPVPVSTLPPQKSISLSRIQRFSVAVGFHDLKSSVAELV